MNAAIILVVVLYVIGMVYIGFHYRKEASSTEGFLTGNRGIGHWVGGGALAVTYMSTASLLGTVSYSYNIGVSWALFGGIGVVLGFIVCMTVLAPRLRGLEVNTFSEFFEKIFGPKTKITSSVIIAIVMFLYLIAQIKGGAHVAEYILNISYPTAVLIMGGVFILYITLGGMLAATVTSFIQGIILILGVALLSFTFLFQNGWGFTIEKLREMSPFYFTSAGGTGVEFGISFGVLMFMSILCVPHVLFRFFASKSKLGAAKTAAVSTIFTSIFYCLIIIPPIIAIILAPGLSDPDTAYLAATEAVFNNNPLIIGFIFAGILSAAMSTADAMLLNASSAIVYDIFGTTIKKNKKEDKIPVYLRMTTILIGVLVILVTISPPSVIMELMILALSMFIGSFLAPVLLGLFYKNKSDLSGVMSMIVGLVITVILHPATPFIRLSEQTYAGIVGTIVSGAVFIIINQLSKKKNVSTKEDVSMNG